MKKAPKFHKSSHFVISCIYLIKSVFKSSQCLLCLNCMLGTHVDTAHVTMLMLDSFLPLSYLSVQLCAFFLLIINQRGIVNCNTIITLYLLVSSADNFCKQFGSRSGPTKYRGCTRHMDKGELSGIW